MNRPLLQSWSVISVTNVPRTGIPFPSEGTSAVARPFVSSIGDVELFKSRLDALVLSTITSAAV
jgi:hypothetical protein